MNLFNTGALDNSGNSKEINEAKSRIEYLKNEINKSNYLYYVEENPYLSDFEYDKLFAEIKRVRRKVS